MINPPTDNLYKFCAIVGILLIVFNTYYGLEMKLNTQNEITKLIGEQKKNILKLEINGKNLHELSQVYKDKIAEKKILLNKKKSELILAKNNRLDKKEFEDIEIENKKKLNKDGVESKKMDSINKIREKENDDLKFEQIEIETKTELIKNLQVRTKMYASYMYAGIFLGLVIGIYGFVNWIKTQKLIDKQLLNSLSKN